MTKFIVYFIVCISDSLWLCNTFPLSFTHFNWQCASNTSPGAKLQTALLQCSWRLCLYGTVATEWHSDVGFTWRQKLFWCCCFCRWGI